MLREYYKAEVNVNWNVFDDDYLGRIIDKTKLLGRKT